MSGCTSHRGRQHLDRQGTLSPVLDHLGKRLSINLHEEDIGRLEAADAAGDDVNDQNIRADENANPVTTLRRRYEGWKRERGPGLDPSN